MPVTTTANIELSDSVQNAFNLLDTKWSEAAHIAAISRNVNSVKQSAVNSAVRIRYGEKAEERATNVDTTPIVGDSSELAGPSAAWR